MHTLRIATTTIDKFEAGESKEIEEVVAPEALSLEDPSLCYLLLLLVLLIA